MGGHVDPVQTGAFLIALRAKGETAAELAGLASVVRARSESVVADEHSARRHLRHRRWALDVQRLHGRRVRGRGSRRLGRQTRQPLGDVAQRQRRRAGGARRQDRPVAGGRGPVRGARRGGVHVRAIPSSRVPAHRTGAHGARRADDLQPARSVDEPGRRASSGDRRVRPCRISSASPLRWASLAPSTRWWSHPRTGWTRSRRARRHRSQR